MNQIEDGYLLLESQVVISLRNHSAVLQFLHKAHPAIVHMKLCVEAWDRSAGWSGAVTSVVYADPSIISLPMAATFLSKTSH